MAQLLVYLSPLSPMRRLPRGVQARTVPALPLPAGRQNVGESREESQKRRAVLQCSYRSTILLIIILGFIENTAMRHRWGG